MTIKIDFDAANNPQPPTIILAKKNGDKLGKLNAVEIELTDSMNDASEISFKVYKSANGKIDYLWNEIIDFRLVHCVEWNQWFEITVETDESTETFKTVSCKNLGCAELSQIMLYNVEINTENDIARDDYDKDNPTILYNPDLKDSSLLHRILEKAPHYTIKNVDKTIANIQRTFSFDDTSIYDAFKDIAEEIKCLFVFEANSDEHGNINRTISVYDLESNCGECGYRGEYTGKCPKCNSTNINEGYGEDTLIFVTADEIAENLNLSSDTDSIKNCFKLEAGDDLMTATVRNCNPNGSDYLWYISDDIKRDMSENLVSAIESYDVEYANYQNSHEYLSGDSDIIEKYNDLVKNYKSYNDDLQYINTPIKGYSSLMNAYYNTIDLNLYLTSGLMPTVKMSDTSAEKEAAKLTADALSPVAVEKIDNISLTTANSVVLSMAKVIADSTRYKITVNDGATLSGSKHSKTRTWEGSFHLINYSSTDTDDDEDVDEYDSEKIEIEINDDYEKFLKQKIDKILSKEDKDNKYGMSALFDIDMEIEDFKSELKKYCLNRLVSFHDACQSCIDILTEQGAANKESWSEDIYNKLYIPYFERLGEIEAEIKIREDEVCLIIGKSDENGDITQYGLQNIIVQEKEETQNLLNFQKYISSISPSLWIEFCSFRREDKYSNDNYVSTGLDNAEIFSKAREFIERASEEIYKSAELQHTISGSLQNLLLINKFRSLVSSFRTGNWLRVMIDDDIYKLRLVEYTIDYDDLDDISVEFSDAVKSNSTIKSVQDVLDRASSMASSYSYVKRQAKQGENGSAIISNWVSNGLDATNTKIVGGSDNQSQTWDNHGMLFRKYNPVTNEYEPEQMKIINSTLAVTDDNWETTKTAVGKYYYSEPTDGSVASAYGVNAETIVGNLLLGKQLKVTNDTGTLIFNEDGLFVENEDSSVLIDPDDDSPIIHIRNKKVKDGKDDTVLSIGSDGNLVIKGNITASKITLLDGATVSSDKITDLASIAIDGHYTNLIGDKSKSGHVLILDDKDDVIAKKLTYEDISGTLDYSNLSGTPSLSTVATSGSYNDLSNKPNLFSGKYMDLTGDKSNAGKLLYVDTDGSVTTLTIAGLKKLLGI